MVQNALAYHRKTLKLFTFIFSAKTLSNKAEHNSLPLPATSTPQAKVIYVAKTF